MIIKSLFETKERDLLVGYYFFRDNDQNKRSVLLAISSMIYQVAEQSELFAIQTAKTCKEFPDFSTATILSLWYDFISPKFEFGSNHRLCLVLDGVDEAIQDDIQKFVNALQESLENESRIQVLFVGRPNIENVISSLSPFSMGSIEVSSKLNSDDIGRFIDYKYIKHLLPKHKVRGLREAVTSTLRARANGMFLWVDLVYQELAKFNTATQVKDQLERMPSGLTALYRKIFLGMETSELSSTRVGQLRELFCYLAQLQNPPTISLLNELIRYTTNDDKFNVEFMIQETCSSLIVYESIGKLRIEEIAKAEASVAPNTDGGGTEGIDTALDASYEDDSEYLNDEEDQAQEKERQEQKMVKLCHASIGDYLNDKDLKSSNILFNSKDAKFHIISTTLELILAGSIAPKTLWIYALSGMSEQLQWLEGLTLTEDQIKFVSKHVVDILSSESIRETISQYYEDRSLVENLKFGLNTEKENVHRSVLLKWIQKANDLELFSDQQTQEWIKATLGTPLSLLAPLAKVLIQDWLKCNGSQSDCYWRYHFAWSCIVSV
jgi:hypothetical protein